MGKQFKKVLSILLVLIIFQQFTLSASIPLFRGQVYAETDTEAPTVPQNLTYEDLIHDEVTLTWEPSTDNVGVTEYDIYEGTTVVESVYETSYTVTSLIPNTEYTFSVKAKDEAENESNASNIVNIKTLLEAEITIDGNISDWDNIDPIASGSGKISSLSAVQDDNKLYILLEGTEITETYDIYIDSDNNSQTGYDAYWIWSNMGADYLIADNELFEYTGSGDDWSFSYVCDVEIVKNANVKEKSVDLTQIGRTEAGVMKIACAASENELDLAPVEGSEMAIADIFITGFIEGAPDNIRISTSDTSITVEWDAVEGATGYEIEVDGVVVDNGNSTTYEHTGLIENTEYIYRVRSRDANGESQWSNIIIGKTLLEVAIQVDGNVSDWENIDPIASGSGKISSLSAVQDDNKLYILLEGTEITETYDIYIDSDNNSQTGYDAYWIWSNMGADYLIADNELFEYTGSGDDWSFSYVCDIEIVKNANVKEKSVDLTQIGRTEAGVMKIACAASENELDLAPVEGSEMAIADIFITGFIEGAPDNIRISTSDTSITVEWDAVEGATGYDIEVDGVVVDNGNSTTYEHTGLIENTEYIYRVRSKDANGESQWSNIIIGKTLLEVAIQVDGNVSDWENIDPIASGSGKISSLSAVQDDNKLYILLEGTEITETYDIYIDSDNNSQTGYDAYWIWSNMGADYLIADNELFEYTGSGDDWSFSYVCDVEIVKNANVKEKSVDLTQIGRTEAGVMKIACAASENELDLAPIEGSDMAIADIFITGFIEGAPDNIRISASDTSITVEWDAVEGATGYDIEVDGVVVDNGNSTTYEHTGLTENTEYIYRVRSKDANGESQWSNIIIGKTLLEVAIQVDGNVSDWENIDPIASGSGKISSLSAVQDDNKLYILLEGTEITETYDIFIDSDNNSQTGYDAYWIWSNMGAEYVIQDNELFEYTGSGDDWSFSYVCDVEIAKNANVKEKSVDLTQIGRIEAGVMKIACTASENDLDFAPIEGSEMSIADIIITGFLEGAPGNIRISTSDTSITVEWDAVEGATGYDIEVDGVVVDNGNSTTYEHTGLTENTEYIYRVRAKKLEEESSWSSEIYATTQLQLGIQSLQIAGFQHSLVVKEDGTVWGFGYNGYSQLGNGTTDDSTIPVEVTGLTAVKKVVGDYYHSIALKEDGTVWVWGGNENGQLGDGTTTNKSTPVQVSGLTGISDVAAGKYHSVALKNDGTVWTWGYNGYGQLGDGTTDESITPIQIHSLTGVKAISANYYHTVALKNDGTVWTWGRNDYGVLGDGTTDTQSTPVQVVGLTGVEKIEAGRYHNIVAKEDGTVWTWGYNNYGQLGDGTTDDSLLPIQVVGAINITEVSGGNYHSLALKQDGTILAWGRNSSGQLGDNTGTHRNTPVQVQGLTQVTAIACAEEHSIAKKSNGTVWTWGYNGYGQLGDGTTDNRLAPIQIEGFGTIGDTEAPTAPTNLIVLTKTDTTVNLLWDASIDNIAVKGYNVYRDGAEIATVTDSVYYRDIGLSSNTTYVYSIKAYDYAANESILSNEVSVTTESVSRNVAVAGGEYFSVALKEDGTVWSWGLNEYGQLGDGTTDDRISPVQVSGLTGIVAIENDAYHNVALKEDGTVWTWGRNHYGQLGDGTIDNRITPVQVSNLTGVVSIASGKYHTIALREDGTVWTWGNNYYSQLGDGTTDDSLIPIQVPDITGVVKIGAGKYHNVVLKNDGTIWTWGYNDYGQLCSDTITDSSEPIQVLGINDVVSIESGYYHSLVLKSDGTVWGWGSNYYNQLGDGTNIDRFTPVQAIGLTEVRAIAGGKYHNIALKEDGTIWSWGQNWDGQLGDGNTTDRAEAIEVPDITGVQAISAGYYHSLASKENGTVWTWGDNDYGQLGDGTQVDREIPGWVLGFSTIGNIEVPSAPQNITALSNTNSVNLTWDIVEGAESYEVEANGRIVDIGNSASYKHTTTAEIEIDGDISDWTSVNTIAQTSEGSIKSVQDNNKLHILITGTGIGVNDHIIIDTDNDSSTGYQTSKWSNTGAEYLLEGERLYSYIGTGEDYTWDYIEDVNINESDTMLELEIDISKLGLSEASDIRIGYWSDTIYLPERYTVMAEAEAEAEGLIPNTAYTYRVRAINVGGVGEWSEVITATTLLGAVTNVGAQSTSRSVMLTWDALDGAESYEVDANGRIVDVGNSTSYKHVTTAEIEIDGDASDWASVNTIAQTSEGSIKSVQDNNKLYILITGTGIGVNDHIIIDTDNDSSTGYQTSKWSNTGAEYLLEGERLYRYIGTGEDYTWDYIEDVNMNESDTILELEIDISKIGLSEASDMKIGYWSDTIYLPERYTVMAEAEAEGLMSNTAYTYRVRAVNISGSGEWSASVTAMTSLGAVTNITAIGSSGTSIDITWDAVEGAAGYEIEVDGEVIETGVTGTSYTHNGLLSNSTHSYRVRVVTAGGAGEWSEEITATTLLGVVANVGAQSTSRSVMLTWDALDGAESYEVEANGRIVDVGNSTSYKNTTTAEIEIDGDASDWAIVNTIAQTSEGSIKSVQDNNKLYILITGTGIGVNDHIIIDTDNDSSTGYQTSKWSNTGAEYLLEGERLYSYIGTGEDYTWDYIEDVNINANDTVLELEIDISKLGLSEASDIRIGYWSDTIYLPERYTVMAEAEAEGLMPDTAYTYRVRAVNAGGVGAWSETINQYTLVDSPKNVNAVVNVSNITVSWDVVNGATGYDIEINGEITENVTSPYIDNRIEPATEYTYKVRAKNANGTGEWSVPVTVEKFGITNEFNCESGQTFEMFLTASNIQDFEQYTFTLEYDPNQIEIIDLCIFTSANETNLGVIGNTGVEIIEYNSETGTIKYILSKSMEADEIWTGIVNGMKFRSKTNEQITVQHSFQ